MSGNTPRVRAVSLEDTDRGIPNALPHKLAAPRPHKRDPRLLAVDTVPAGTMVTWTWSNTGSTSHSVESEGTTSFASSDILTGSGMTYSVTFTTPGTYEYDCAVHGQAMSGTIVVQ